jgi:hypothetical protein
LFFGLTGGFGVAVGVAVGLAVVLVVDGAAVPAVVVLLADGAAASGVAVAPAVLVLPEAGAVDVAGAAGSVVSGVGSGGNGFDITPAIRSVRPASD